MSVKGALDTAQIAAKEIKEQLVSMEKKHDALERGLLAGFNEAQAALKKKKQTLRKQSKMAKHNLYEFRLTEVVAVEQLLV